MRKLLFRTGLVATLVFLGGCAKEGPIDAFGRFVDALAERDAAAAWQALAKADRERFAKDSQELAELSQGAVKRTPEELLVATALRAKRGKRTVSVVKEDAERAVLRVALEPTGDDQVTMVQEAGKWRVLLTAPPAPAAPEGAVPAPPPAGPG